MLIRLTFFIIFTFMSGIVLADTNSVVITLSNQSHYVLFPDANQSNFESACVQATSKACTTAITSQNIQKLTINKGDNIYLGFSVNPINGNYFGASLSFDGKNINFGNPNIPNVKVVNGS